MRTTNEWMRIGVVVKRHLYESELSKARLRKYEAPPLFEIGEQVPPRPTLNRMYRIIECYRIAVTTLGVSVLGESAKGMEPFEILSRLAECSEQMKGKT